MSLSREEIIRMAREAGYGDYAPAFDARAIRYIALLINAAYAAGAAAEREACAKVCDRGAEAMPGKLQRAGAARCAAAIRARGDK